jgi:hypothetical protein
MRPGIRMFAGAAGIALLIAGGMSLRSDPVTVQSATAIRAARPSAARASGQQATEAGQDAREDVLATGAAARRPGRPPRQRCPATAREIEPGSDGGGGDYEVELVRPDGSTVDVRLDAHFKVVWIGY